MSLTTDRLQQHHQAGTITDKELEVLELHHMSDRAISLALGISRRSVRDRRANAARKIQLAEEAPHQCPPSPSC